MLSDRLKNYLLVSSLVVILLLLIIIVEPYAGSRTPPDNTSTVMTDGMPAMILKTYDVAAGQPVPTVDFTLQKDALDGWDLHILTTNFTFTPQDINQAPQPNRGHVHLYIDDTLSVVFGSWYHIDSIPAGTHTIKVSLNNNDHSVYTFQGKQIEAEQTITVK